MKHLKTFESYNQDNVLSIKISDDTLKDAYWKGYYPIAKDEEIDEEGEQYMMTADEYIEGILDGLSGELREFLNDELNANIKSLYSKTPYDTLDNIFVNTDNGSIDFVTNKNFDEDDIKKVHNFLDGMLSDFISNRNYRIDDADWEIIFNGNDDDDYSNISQRELIKMMDDAMDSGDFETVKKIRPYLESNFTDFFKDENIIKGIKGLFSKEEKPKDERTYPPMSGPEEVQEEEEEEEEVRSYPRKSRGPRKGGYRPREQQKFPCVYSFMTKELADRIRERRGGPIGIAPDGYSLFCETPEELKEYKEKYKTGNTYNGETITGVYVHSERHHG